RAGRGRRTRLRAGRVGPGPGGQPAAGPAGRAGPGVPDDRPRPGGGAPRLAPPRHPLLRAAGGAGSRGRRVRPARPPLHRGAAVERPHPGPGRAAPAPPNRARGRDPEPHRSSAGLPLPHPLPAGPGALPAGDPAARREVARPPGRLLGPLRVRDRVLRAVGVGLAAGFLSGLFGVGGGILIVPALVLVMGLDQRLAHGTSLAAVLPIALASLV